jgi:hypothetical protein
MGVGFSGDGCQLADCKANLQAPDADRFADWHLVLASQIQKEVVLLQQLSIKKVILIKFLIA